ncbi:MULTISPECIES: FliC/FljB family flagellin [unclassified Halomonas]|uniref:FliC/FljB family flagellin n=1 Tax=unclassified Halomonas TaxID=2609666 RepID=UPI000C91D41D|nr:MULTISPECIES: FliC/FljB family flagellin [unclassified Halomonas]MAR71784.1 flagellin FliC [Halomonas sp.]
MSVINTNITSMIGQQNLNASQSALTTSMERLSSGLRINSAKDDAAGQAIANRMSSQITGLSQAQRNANDGISVAQTAEGALNQVNDNLQRVRELTVQAQNDTNSADDLTSIQKEIDQRLQEINRISDETSFNGVKVLKEEQTLSIQVGANDDETIEIDLQSINADTLEMKGFSVEKGIDESKVASAATSATVATAIDHSGTDVSSIASDAVIGSISAGDNGKYYANVTSSTSSGKDGKYEVDVAEDGSVSLVDATADSTTGVTLSAATDLGDGGVAFTGEDKDKVHAYTGSETGAPAYVIKDQDDDGNDVYYEAKVADDGAVTRGNKLATSLPTEDPLATIDNALNQVDTLRSDLGAIQNRFESAITNLSTTTTNLSAARSRIEDADYAVEVANMTRAQILQQAGTSVLAQANQVPQGVLSLLG